MPVDTGKIVLFYVSTRMNVYFLLESFQRASNIYITGEQLSGEQIKKFQMKIYCSQNVTGNTGCLSPILNLFFRQDISDLFVSTDYIAHAQDITQIITHPENHRYSTGKIIRDFF